MASVDRNRCIVALRTPSHPFAPTALQGDAGPNRGTDVGNTGPIPFHGMRTKKELAEKNKWGTFLTQ